MNGSDSPQTKLTRALADELRKQGDLSVELWDERLSSFQADLVLDSADVRPSRRRKLRDAVAAQVVLQSYLDARQ
jgi:putative Holliday junction resolvase